ncbi:Acyl-CoA oxidase [Actinobacteria bacterium OK074]|nr:Acyl-CoA oxidase [Actinobacteria bacterium OK074]
MPHSLSPSPHAELGEALRRLVHGSCEPSFLATLHKALTTPTATDDDPPAPAGDGRRILRRLRVLGDELAPYRALLGQPDQLAALHAWSAVADPSLCLTALVHQHLCLGSIVQLADDTSPLADRIADLEAGRAKGVYLVTEAGQAGSHLATRTRAEFDPETREFVLRTPDVAATKFGSAGTLGVPQTAVVIARLSVAGTDRGVFAFVVDLGDGTGPAPGVEVSSRLELGALPLDYVQVRFDGVRVPYAHWLSGGARIDADGRPHDPLGSADLRLQHTLRVGQGLWATVPSAAAATCRQAAVLAVEYARRRPSQGRLAPGAPLLDYRAQQRAVLGALAEGFALTCAARGALRAWAASTGAGSGAELGFTPWAAVSRSLAVYKAVTIRTAARAVADCRSRCGFSGHLDLNRLADYQGFLEAFDTAGGDSRLIFYDVGRALVEQPPQVPSTSTSSAVPVSDPTSVHWWPELARRHEELLAERLRRRLRLAGQAADGAEPFAVWNPLLEDVGLLGEVHAARRVAEDVARTLAETAPEPAAVLAPLAALHGVTTARRHLGSLLAVGALRPSEADELPYAADRLCDAVLPRLPLLTDAFGYPEDLVAAPLGAADPAAALDAVLTWTRGGAA